MVDWLEAIDRAAPTSVTARFPRPGGIIATGAGEQTFLALLRKTAGSPNPTVAIKLQQGGTPLATLLTGVSVTSLIGNTVQATWDAAPLVAEDQEADADGTLEVEEDGETAVIQEDLDVECVVEGSPGIAPWPFVVASATGTAVANSQSAGVTVTHGFTLADGDVLYAFIGQGDDLGTGWASSSGGTWQQLANQATATGNDRASGVLRRVIINAGAEPATYTFTRPGSDAVNNLAAIVVQVRNVAATPEDATTTLSQGSDDFTPSGIGITTTTGEALALTFHLASGVTGKTAGAPAGFDLVDSVAAEAGSFPLFLEVAATVKAAAGSVTVGSWTGTPDDATSEWDVITVAVRAGAGAAINTVEIGALNWLATASGEALGQLEAREARDAAAGAGVLPIAGDIAAVETADAAILAGGVLVQGALAATGVGDALAAEGIVATVVAGDLAATEAVDAAALAGAVTVQGDAGLVESQDAPALAGSVLVSGTVDVDETGDAAAAAGTVLVQGAMDAVETTTDAASFIGAGLVFGQLAATDAKDVATASAQLIIQGALSAADASDTAAASASLRVLGVVAATDVTDVAAATGEVHEGLISGALAVVETAQDAAAMMGAVIVAGQLTVTEAADTFAATSRIAVAGDLQVTEAATDVAAIQGRGGVRQLARARLTDTTPPVTAGARPAFRAASIGIASAAQSGTIAPVVPDDAAAGDLLIFAAVIIDADASAQFQPPPGYVLLDGSPFGTGDAAYAPRLHLAWKLAGAQDLGAPQAAQYALSSGDPAARSIAARLYAFSGGNGFAAAPVVAIAVTEGVTEVGGMEIACPSVAGGTRLLGGIISAVASVAGGMGNATGETGGDWQQAVSEYSSTTGGHSALDLQVAVLPPAGAITGGAIPYGGIDDAWIAVGFALAPARVLGATAATVVFTDTARSNAGLDYAA